MAGFGRRKHMKKLGDWDDGLIDLDNEPEYDDGKDYDGDYDEEDMPLPDRKIVIPVVIAALLVIVTVLGIVLAVVVRSGDKAEPVVQSEHMPDAPLTEREAEVQEPGDDPGQTVEADETEENILPAEDSAEKPAEVTGTEQTEPGDPQGAAMSAEQGTEVDVTTLLSSDRVAETQQVTIGIDVAKYQGTIDWAQAAASGIDFAMVRVGYRADSTREICADTNAKYNMQEAQKNGIKVGAYFFSTAVSEQEAVEEADWVADYIAGYQITYPVAFDCEGFDQPDSAQYGLTNAERTDIAIAFLQEIYNRGYTPMFYAAMGELSGSAKWDTQRLENQYRIWVSQYPSVPYPETAKSSYGGVHAMWQYTNQGTVAGIGRPVDVNVAYFGYEGAAEAQSAETPEEVHADAEALMNFTEVNETVTAKDSTNLRNIPSQGEESNVVYTLKNGETAVRTGVSDSGWSRLTYEGQTVYAVSSYLTTDLGYQTPVQEGAGSGDGLKTKFADRNDQVTAKIEVNLRALPSVTNPDATVIAVLHNGEYVTRTGINEEYGWSRVDYNGQTLYCISSYLMN